MKRKISFFDSSFCIVVFWLAGMLSGIALARYYSLVITPSISDNIFMPPSFGGMVLSTVLPICAVLLFIRMKCRLLVLLIMGIDGLLFGFCIFFLSNYLNCISLFVRMFYMFSQSCRSTLLLLLCMCTISDLFRVRQGYGFLFISSSVLISLFDYFL